VVDRLERFGGVFLELDSATDQLNDILADVCGPEVHLGVVGRVCH